MPLWRHLIGWGDFVTVLKEERLPLLSWLSIPTKMRLGRLSTDLGRPWVHKIVSVIHQLALQPFIQPY